jgi:lipoprotein-releasing system ATP-binding protein
MSAPATLRLEARDLHKRFASGDGEVEVLRGISLSLAGGEALAITGPSGSGKSTLLHLLGTLDRPSTGSLSIGGTDPFALGERDLARFRNRTVGFVFQDHHLLPQYSVLENVLIPAHAFPDTPPGVEARARTLLGRVGLEPRLDQRPATLSGGERQRAAIARALVHLPALLLCDEPTGDLDGATAAAVADLLFELHREQHNILVVVTHSIDLAQRFPRRLHLHEGRCSEA